MIVALLSATIGESSSTFPGREVVSDRLGCPLERSPIGGQLPQGRPDGLVPRLVEVEQRSVLVEQHAGELAAGGGRSRDDEGNVGNDRAAPPLPGVDGQLGSAQIGRYVDYRQGDVLIETR